MNNCDGRRRQAFASAVLATALCLGFSPPTAADPLVLNPHASVSEQYNNNIFFDNQYEWDFVTRIGAGLTLQYQKPKLTAWLSGGTAAQVFANHPNQNSAAGTQYGTLFAEYRAAPRLTLSATDALAHVDQTRTGPGPTSSATTPPPGQQPGPETAVSTLLPRGGVFSNFFSASASYLMTPRWSGSLGYANALSNFTNPGGYELSNAVRATISYAWSPRLSLSGRYSYLRLNPVNGVGADSNQTSCGATYQYDPTLALSGFAGVFFNQPLGANSDSISTRTGPLFNVSLTKNFEQSSVLLGANQTVTTSAGIAGTSVTRTAFLVYDFQITRNLNASASSSYADFNTSATNFNVLQALAVLNYSLGQYVSAGLSYTYRRHYSTQTVPGAITQGAVDNNLVQLYVTAFYPVWRGDL